MKKIIVVTLIALVCLSAGLAAYMFVLFKQMSAVSQGAAIQNYPSEKAALLVIDVQESLTGDLSNSFTKGMKAQSDPLIRAINKTVDWAGANNMPVVYIRQENTDKLYNLLTCGMLAKGSLGAQIDKRAKVSGANIFGKQKMDAFSNPMFEALLNAMQINKLYVTGLDAAYCVDRTIKGGLGRGYKITVVQDALISSTPEKKDDMIDKYTAEGVSITTSDELPAPVGAKK